MNDIEKIIVEDMEIFIVFSNLWSMRVFKYGNAISIKISIQHEQYGSFGGAYINMEKSNFIIKEYKRMRRKKKISPEFRELIKGAIKRSRSHLVKYLPNYRLELTGTNKVIFWSGTTKKDRS